MLATVKDELISAYASIDFNTSSTNIELVDLCKKYGSGEYADDFGDAKDRIEKCFRKLHVAMKRETKSQVQLALLTLLDNVDMSEFDYLKSIISLKYYPNWSDNQQRFFDNHSERISRRDGLDYFISFSDQDATVNTEYAELIKGLYTSKDRLYAKAKGAGVGNMLARGVHQYFRLRGLKGYCFTEYSDDIKFRDDFSKQISEWVRKVNVLVQVVQNSMFKKSEDFNYSFKEYNAFKEGSKRMEYVCAEGEIAKLTKLDRVPIPYQQWRQAIEKATVVELNACKKGEKTPAITAYDKIKQLVLLIEGQREEFLSFVPD